MNTKQNIDNYNSFYLHGITHTQHGYNQKQIIIKLKEILLSDAILSLRKQNKTESVGFNGLDYISLCDYDKRKMFPKEHPRYNAYEEYIRKTLSIMFPKNKLNVITPTLVDISTKDRKGYIKMAKLGKSASERFSDLCDEVQIKDEISLKLMSGITLPVKDIYNILYSEKKAINTVVESIDEITNLLLLFGYDPPIYDIDTFLNIQNPDNVKKLVKKYHYNK